MRNGRWGLGAKYPLVYRVEYGLFFLSGVSGLLLEVLWLRELGLLFGNTTYAMATTLSAFFLGTAAGGFFWGRRCPRITNPLRAYAALELGVALAAILFLVLRKAYAGVYGPLLSLFDTHLHLTVAKFVLAGVVVFIPAVFMGGTFPVIGESVIRGQEQLGTKGSVLYGVNLLGGVTGAFLAGFYLPRLWGYGIAYAIALGIVILTALMAFFASLFVRGDARRASRPRHRGVDHTTPHVILWVAFASGLLTLGLEVLWVRAFALVLQNSVYSFAVILVTFLAALAGGAGIARVLAARTKRPMLVLGILLVLGAGITLAATLLFYQLSGKLSYVGNDAGWREYLGLVFLLSVLVVGPSAIAVGSVFPFLLRVLQSRGGSIGAVIGRLVAANALGAAIGPIAVGFFFLRFFGLWPSFVVLAACYVVLALVVAARSAREAQASRWRSGLAVFGVGTVLAALAVGLFRIPAVAKNDDQTVHRVWHSSYGTVAVVTEKNNLKLLLDNYYTLGDTRSLGNERMQAHIPLLLHPRPRSVYILGLGTGITAGAALTHQIQKVVVVELIPAVVSAANMFFEEYTNDLFKDGRVTIVVGDGRHYLVGNTDRYDVVISDLFTPWHAGTAALYTKEHFETVRSRLTEDGVFAQWLPLYQLSKEEFFILARTMLTVFPQVTLWRGDFSPERPTVALVGHQRPTPLDVSHLVDNLQHLLPTPLLREEATAVGFMGLFYAGNLTAGRDLMGTGAINTDDRPVIEFLAPIKQRQFIAQKEPRFVGPWLSLFYEELLAAAPPEEDLYLQEISAEQKQYFRAGLSWLNYKMLEEQGDVALAHRYEERFYRQVPEGLRRLIETVLEPELSSE